MVNRNSLSRATPTNLGRHVAQSAIALTPTRFLHLNALETSLELDCVSQYSRSEMLYPAGYRPRNPAGRTFLGAAMTGYGSDG